ncbi:hypothetical protein SLEP1_g31432 [Rubroshorea leprosula]|uniref:Uncharacterized protein n=1 Tax=Rubroshorea leprosula TaxID=152421 RepID=A0AAV5KAH4_9ROSI|nr:hypothetical protein SLEP1_g31432 [Rubroshorea leprosula]
MGIWVKVREISGLRTRDPHPFRVSCGALGARAGEVPKLTSSYLSSCNSSQPLALAALQLTAHLQLSSKTFLSSNPLPNSSLMLKLWPHLHGPHQPLTVAPYHQPVTASQHRLPLAPPRLGCPLSLSVVAWLPPLQLCLRIFSNSPTLGSDNNGNFFNLFEELEENDNEDDESEEVISST